MKANKLISARKDSKNNFDNLYIHRPGFIGFHRFIDFGSTDYDH